MTYKIGTRVRHVVSLGGNVPVGAEGIILDVLDGDDWGLGNADYFVRWGRYGDYVSDERQLSPILPDGHRPAKQGSFEPLDHLLSRLKGVKDGQTV